MQLQKVQSIQDIIIHSNYPAAVKGYMELAVSPLFSKQEKAYQVLLVSNLLEQAFSRTGQMKLNSEEKAFTVNEIIDYVLERKYITCDELSEIFKRGSLGKFGDFYGINVASVSKWIDMFYKLAERQSAISKLNELQKSREAVTEVSKEEKEKIIKKAILDAFEDRKKHGWEGVEGLSYPMYDYLAHKKIIALSEIKRQYLKEEATAHIQAQHGKSPKDMRELYEQGKIDPILLAKTFAVRDWMNELIMNGKDIKDFVCQ